MITPAKANGYERIWLVGFSLGGLGSLLYSMHYPDDIQGMLVIAPFLGDSDLIEEISRASGPLNWEPGATQEEDGVRRMWHWLKNYRDPNNELPVLHLGYGRWDKFATAQDMLASILPPDHVHVISGWHNWRTWRKLWKQSLDAGVFE